jgi:hypothetical protein
MAETQVHKTGRPYSTPIGFLHDSETIIALSRGSNWYKNAVATGCARLCEDDSSVVNPHPNPPL